MKRWYVVQVYAGYEEQVKADIQKRIEETGLQDLFGQILIPSARMKQFFEVGDAMHDQQLFPGYILIEMEAAPEAIRLVNTRPRVLRFLGGKEPVPLTAKEVERIQAQVSGAVVVPTRKHELEVGREVEIKEGPFAGFVGLIDKINEESEKLTVMVSIFGRMTPVELSFDQIKR
jgi:transcription termination/antitermination protein NusG